MDSPGCTGPRESAGCTGCAPSSSRIAAMAVRVLSGMLLPIRLARHLCVAVWRGAREIALGLRRAAGRFANQVIGVVRFAGRGAIERCRMLRSRAASLVVGARRAVGIRVARARRVAGQTLDRTPSRAPVHAWIDRHPPRHRTPIGTAADASQAVGPDDTGMEGFGPSLARTGASRSIDGPPVRRGRCASGFSTGPSSRLGRPEPGPDRAWCARLGGEAGQNQHSPQRGGLATCQARGSEASLARGSCTASIGSRAIREPGDWCRSIGRADRDRTLPDAAIARGVVGRRSPPSGRHQSRARRRLACQTLARTQSQAPVHARIDRHPPGRRTTIGTAADASQADGPDDTGVEGFVRLLARTGTSRCIDGPTVRRGRCASCFSTGSSRRLARPEPGPDRAWCARLGGEAGQNQHRP